jgi:hypothetical protein
MHKLTAQDLLAGGSVTHEIAVPRNPQAGFDRRGGTRAVRLRPLMSERWH